MDFRDYYATLGVPKTASAKEIKQAMQGIDHMEQMLMGLATYLNSLSNEASHDWHVDTAAAVSQITLGDLARR